MDTHSNFDQCGESLNLFDQFKTENEILFSMYD